MRAMLVFSLVTMSSAVPLAAFAQDSGPYHARAGTQLAQADEELKIFYAVLNAKIFDVEISKTLLDDLKSSLDEAKSSSFRAMALLDEKQSKLEPEFKKLQDALKRAQDAAKKLADDTQKETANLKVEEEDTSGLAPAAGSKPDEPQKGPDWDLLKADAGAAYQPIAEARSIYGKLAKQVKMPPLKAPPAPKAKK